MSALMLVLVIPRAGAAVIVSVVETGGDGAPGSHFTGETFSGALGNGSTYTVPLFGATVKAYTDRTHAWTNASGTVLIPPYLLNQEYIMTRNDNRDNNGGTNGGSANIYNLAVTVNSDVQVFLLIDNRLGDAANGNPPRLSFTNMSWVTNEGWAPVTNGINRTANITIPDEIGIDESADGTINNWSSIYSKTFPAGTFVLKQGNNPGQNMYGAVVVNVAPSNAPPAPANIAAANSDTQVTLTWSAAPTASGYNIKRSSTSGSGYTQLATVAGTTFTDTGLVNNVDYFYVITATNVIGESTNSLEVVGHPNVVVTGLTAVGGTGQVSVAWSALAGADSYSVLRANSAGGPFAPIATGILIPSYVDTAVLNATPYFYRVGAAFSGGSTSAPSATVSATVAPGTPSLTAVLFASTVIRLGWTPAQTVASYVVERSTDGTNFSPVASLGNVNSFTNSGLSLSNTYYYRVQATNSGGVSPYSNIAGTNTPVFGLNVNFGSGANASAGGLNSPIPPGYLKDIGESFGDRTNGQFYGWITLGSTNGVPQYGTNITRDARWRQNALSPDLRYDTFLHMMKADTGNPSLGAVWEIQVPNGPYIVHLVSGESDNADGVEVFDVEGTITPTYNQVGVTGLARWGDMVVNCSVSDGKLSIKSAAGAVNTKICFVDIYPDIPIPPVIAVNPVSQTSEEYRLVNLSVTLSQGTPRLDYQWFQNDNPVPSGTNRVLTFDHVRATNAGDYYVIVTNYGGAATSAVATLTVTQDITNPYVVSVGSIDGKSIGVCFNEELDNSQLTATETSNYSVNNNAVNVLSAVLRPDRRSVQLFLETPVTGTFTLDVFSQYDLAQNYLDLQSTNGTVLGLTTGDVGSPTRAGSNYSCDNDTIEIVGGGADIWGTMDQGYFATKSTTGDFDARVRVLSLAGSNTVTKAVLVARENIESNSPALHISVNPTPPGRDQYEMGLRPTTNGATVAVGSTFIPAAIPNTWMRITRVGNLFSGYRSSNGLNWVLLGQTNIALSSTMVVGIGVTAHDATLLSTGSFKGLTISQTFPDLAVTKVAAPEPVTVGGNLTYTITVTNIGPGAAANTVVTDLLPNGLSYVSATPSQGAAGHVGNLVTANLGTIASLGSATVTIVATATNAGTITNLASVTTSDIDSNPGNNAASAVTTINAGASQQNIVSFGYSTNGFSAAIQTQDGITYALQYKNNLNTNVWTTLSTFNGDGTVKTFNDPNPGQPMRFYQIIIP